MADAAIVGDGLTGSSHPPTINHSKGADKTGNAYAHNCVAFSIETFNGEREQRRPGAGTASLQSDV